MLFSEALNSIKGLDEHAMKQARNRLDSLSKPLGSLGRLEDIIAQIAGITGQVMPCVDKKTVVIMCSDNGVVDEGITQVGRDVTASVTKNFLNGITGINVLAKHAGADIMVVDMGIECHIDCEGVLNKKIRCCTWNIAKGPAMTREEAIQAMETGIEIIGELKRQGTNLIGTGEMGIGNTTTSSAIATVLTGCDAQCMVGRGAGLSNDGLTKKLRVIDVNKPSPRDAVDVLTKLGGFDIAALTGCFIGAGVYRMPILIDGFISATAALTAIRICPAVKDFIFPSHGSAEPGTEKVMQALKMEPLLNLEMRLGEGTGAALAFHIIDAAITAYKQMGTFNDAAIEKYVPQS